MSEEEEGVVLLNDKGETKHSTRKALKELAKKVDETYTDMGRHLYNVYYGDYFEEWGFADFEEYCVSELGFAERKAKYLITIWKRLVVDLGVSRKKLERIGWTKLSKIVNLVDEDTVETWLDKARTLKVSDLEKEVKRFKGDTDADEDYTNINFKLAKAQSENVEAALAIAEAEAGSDKRGHLLDLICTEFMAGHLDPSQKLPSVLKSVQRVYGVKVVALKDPEMFKKVRAFVKELQSDSKDTKKEPAKKAPAKKEPDVEEAEAAEDKSAEKLTPAEEAEAGAGLPKKRRKKKKTGAKAAGEVKKAPTRRRAKTAEATA